MFGMRERGRGRDQDDGDTEIETETVRGRERSSACYEYILWIYCGRQGKLGKGESSMQIKRIVILREL